MSKYNLIRVFVFIVASNLVGCKVGDQKIPETTENLCDFDNNGLWSWDDIQIGVSTSKDLIDSLGQPDFFSTYEHKASTTTVSVYTYSMSDHEEGDTPDSIYAFSPNASFVSFKLINDLVIALEPQPPGYFLGKSDITYSDLLNAYGETKLFGFSNLYSHSRTAVWPDKGVQATIKIFNPLYNPPLISNPKIAQVSEIQYFCSVTKEKYLSSFLSGWYTESRPSGDEIDSFPMNPFILDN